MIKPITFLVALYLPLVGVAQTTPEIEWQRCLGGSGDEAVRGMHQTTDNGYIMIGSTNSSNGQVTGFHGGAADFWLVKTDAMGNFQWQHTYGGSDTDSGQDIQQTSDGGYILAGTSRSNNGDVSGNHGSSDVWVLKVDANGAIEWQRCYGGTGVDACYAIKQTPDGGYIFSGETQSNDGDVTFNNGSVDFWVVKIDATGAIQWQRALGGGSIDFSYSLDLTDDGGCVVAGLTASDDGDVTEQQGQSDVWITKLDGNGELVWQKSFGGSQGEQAGRVARAIDGGYFVCGSTRSMDGDVTGHHGSFDAWVLKLDAGGALQWQKALGGSLADYAAVLSTLPDGGCLVAGGTASNDGDVSESIGEDDVWLLRLSPTGDLLWESTFGGSSTEGASRLVATSEGGYALAGLTTSNDGDVSGNHGSSDMWLVKLSGDFTTLPDRFLGFGMSVYPNPSQVDPVVKFELLNATHVRIEVYDVAGRKVVDQENGLLAPGQQNITLPMSSLPPGVYSIALHLDNETVWSRVIKL